MRWTEFALCFLVFALMGLGAQALAEKETSAVQQAIKTLESALKQGQPDPVLAAVDGLMNAFIDSEDDKEKEQIADAMGKALKVTLKEGEIAAKAAQYLGAMGSVGAKPLGIALKDKKLRKNETMKGVYLAAIRGLGATKSLKDVLTLVNLLKDKDSYVIAAAADGLGNYNDAKMSVRRKVAEELIKTLTSAFSAAESDPRNTSLMTKYEIISPSLFGALQKVTGASVSTPPDWRKWFNDNKKKQWK